MTLQFLAGAFPFTSVTSVPANVTTIEGVDATDALTAAAAAAILATPANKLATDSNGYVTPTAASKTGYSLSATGLDAIADPDDLTPATVPSTFTQKLRWMIQRFWRADKTAAAITVKNEAGQTITSQAITTSGDDETLETPA